MNIILHMAWRNIWRNKRRTWLSVAGIGFSTFLFVFVMPLQFGAYDLIIDASLRMFTGYAQIQKSGYQQQPLIHNTIENATGLAQSIRDSQEFEAVAVRASGFALMSSRERSYGAQVMGVQVGHEPRVSIIPANVKQGRFLSDDDAREIFIGAALARNLKVKVGDEVTILGSGKDGSLAATILPVVGIFETGSEEMDRYITEIPLHTFQHLFSMGNSAHNISVIGKSIHELDTIPQRLGQFIQNNDDLVVLGWGELMPGIKEGLQMDKASGFIFMIVLVIVVAFSILNTFLMLVLERTKEFGLMLALGDKPFNISKLVMLESTLMTGLGLVIGIAVAVLLNLYFLKEGFRYPGMRELMAAYNMPLDTMYPKFDAFTILFGPAVVLLSTNLAAWLPLRRIHRLKPVDAMRTV
jgi:ABC-type lipoprotein release transport system permease subunit